MVVIYSTCTLILCSIQGSSESVVMQQPVVNIDRYFNYLVHINIEMFYVYYRILQDIITGGGRRGPPRKY